MADTVINVALGQMDLTPYYMANLSRDIFFSAKAYTAKQPRRRWFQSALNIVSAKKNRRSGSRRQWHKYFLYSVSIELGLKAALLNNNNTTSRKEGNKQIGHDLKELREEAAAVLPNNFFDRKDKETMDKVAPFFGAKSLEYPSAKFIKEMMFGGGDLPDVESLEAVAEKVVCILESNRFFIGSNTPPQGVQ